MDEPTLHPPTHGSVAIGELSGLARDGRSEPNPAQPALGLADLDGPTDEAELVSLLESLLLVSSSPTTSDELARGAGATVAAVDAALALLERRVGAGWVLQRHADKIQLTTAPRFARYVRRYLNLDREARLSGASLETLAIVAYQQPVTRAEIEAVRGVDCSGVLATLIHRGQIEQVGRLASPGNPIQYGTTPDFLLHFGLSSLADLPPLGSVDGADARQTLDAVVAAAEMESNTTAS